MKKLLCVFLAALLILCAVPAVFADSNPSAEIDAHNLIVADNVYLAYRVRVTGNPADYQADDSVGVFVWDHFSKIPTTLPTDGKFDEQHKPYKTELASISGNKAVRAYKFTDIVAKQMTDDFYAVAYVKKGGKYYYGETIDKYSVVQYAYNKMGKTGTSGTADANLISLLDGMLAYGAANQKHFKPEGKEYYGTKLATDPLVQVKTVGATLPDRTTSGLYKSGESVKLTANAETNWYNELGKNLGTGKTEISVTPTNNTVITATNEDRTETAPVIIAKTASADTVAEGGTVVVNLAITNNTAEMQTVTLTETLTNATMLTDELAAGTPKDYYIPAGETVNVTYGLTATATGTITAATTATVNAKSLDVDEVNIPCTGSISNTKNVFIFGDATMYSVQPLLAAMATENGYKLNIVAATSNTPSGVQNSYNIQELFDYSESEVNVKENSLKDALESGEKCDFVIPTGANITLGDKTSSEQARAAIKYIADNLDEGETLYLLLSPAYDDGYDFSATYRDEESQEEQYKQKPIFGGKLTNIKSYSAHAKAIRDEAEEIKKELGNASNVKFIKAGYAYTDVKGSTPLYRNEIVGSFNYTNADGKSATAHTVVNKYRFPNLNGQYLIAACISKALFGDKATIPVFDFVENAQTLKAAANKQTVDFDLGTDEPPIDDPGKDNVEITWDD